MGFRTIDTIMSKPGICPLLLQMQGKNKRAASLDERPAAMTQQGSAIVVVLLVMTAVTVIGLLSIHSSAINLKIAHGEKRLRQSFYLAEGVALEGVQRISDTTKVDLEDKIASWHHSREEVRADSIDFRVVEDWHLKGEKEEYILQSDLGTGLYLTAVEWRLATGGSAVMTGSRLYLNRIYGLNQAETGHRIVEIGAYSRY